MIIIAGPLAGWVTPLDEVPDPVFADRMLGDGVAIDPTDGRLVAPGDGTIESVHPAGHAVTIALDAGPVLLLHVGLDTVALDGEGFTPGVKAGDRVATGDLLVTIDLDAVGRRARSLVTPVVVTNGDAFAIEEPAAPGVIAAGAPLFVLRPTGAAAVPAVAKAMPEAERTLALPLAHGLHARPAARIAALAAETGAADLVTADGRTASAKSAVAMLALALRHGDMVTVRGDTAAVSAIAELLETGMGEHRAVAAPMPAAPVTLPDRLTGIAAVPGLAIGPAFRLRTTAIAVREEGQSPALERQALGAARFKVRKALEEVARRAGDGAGIAAAHLAFLDDPEVSAAAERTIDAGKSAGFAWRAAIEGFVAPLLASADRRFAERIDDLRDLEHRVLAALDGGAAAAPALPEAAILVADDLLPSQLMALDTRPAGIALARGGATSHVAIIAAGMGVPMTIGLGPALGLVEDGTDLILADGALTIAPSAAVMAATRADADARAVRRKAAEARAHEPAVTTDGIAIEVVANLGSAADARAAVAAGAEGCGLLRTEFLFLDRAQPPGEAEQRAAYQAIADALGPRPLIVRTLDIGADKPAPWLALAAEENPALGLRGIRLQLARRDLLETQLRALLGVRTEGALSIMLPMVADRAELSAVRALLVRLADDAGVALPALGIMVETPAAALTAASLAEDAAFFSIGSNDLSQYALARDRTNPAVAAGLDGLHPAVLRLIDETVRGGAIHGRWTGVCGGLASVPEAVPVLLGLGVTELSVPPAAVAEIKALVRGLDMGRCRGAARAALIAPDADTVRALSRPLMEDAA
ncbi:phosphocarrier protein HPr /phosphoenolpyruvate--protein phosphotransferase /PTS system IIA component (Glc family) [Hephaestia caeni]|uniref:phosphoenolpyruvate--protein phosphotransferase n=1 Tax=Hephaestia caeni TaxID=645617 RepID=A0A397PE92_9SPHN|nr:phosphoenolpyruvate--protein phosphotransferase [Hephaestia caeni]RIA44474.1 phosphocarrier protein HPr /phosphoenolpyruvate--protein phosphotransferase /PTS system IIA component (Glc family) [Hephaestia caeni]